jgi:urea transport system permease protein
MVTPIDDLEPANAPSSPAIPAGQHWRRAIGTMIGCFILFAGVLAPAFYYADNTHRLILFGRCAAMSLLALGADLVWGYTGLLSLGQGVYFGIGAYMVAYSLKLKETADRYNAVMRTSWAPGVIPPDFMVDYGPFDLNDPETLPTALSFIAPLGNIWIALAAAIVIPMAIAFLFSLLTFKRGIRGVYFSLITQAIVLIAFLVADNQQPITGGRPGINEIAYLDIGGFTFENNAGQVPQVDTQFFGHTVNRNRSLRDLYLLISAVLFVCFLGCLFLVRTKFGKILKAIRDNEARVLALGYNTALYKTFVFTLAAGLAGLGGALFVPVIGKMGPTYTNVAFSIEVVIFVAVGGRGTLAGAVLGTFLVHYGTSLVGEAAKEWRPIILGSLFVFSVMAMPEGILGVLRNAPARLSRWFGKSKQTLSPTTN